MTDRASLESAPGGGTFVQPTDPLIGRTLDGRYKIERLLGEGGMGIVYKAVHTTLGKPLAIKVLRPEVSKNEEILQRFRQEAQSASQIGNPHIIDISDFGTLVDGSTYFVMEFLTGKSLTAALAERGGLLDVQRSVHVVRQLAGALAAAHEIGVVHRDLKPDNVQLVERGGQKDFVKVLDFGIAKVGGSTSKLTQAGQVFGTPHYMSPEQCAGTDVDHRTDIYAVGVMLYEMTTGRVPFDAENLMGILTKQLYENPIAPTQLSPSIDVSPALEAIILKCLQKKPAARYQSMSELASDLDALERGLRPRALTDQAARAEPAAVVGPQTLTGVEARATWGGTSPDIALRKDRKPLVLALGTAAILAALGVWTLLAPTAPSAKPNEPAVQAIEPQPTAASRPAAEATPAAQPAEAAAAATLTLTSTPDHAEVYVQGERKGTTPYVLVKPSGEGTLSLELRLSGYASKAVAIASTADDTRVVLQALPKSEPKPAAKATKQPRPAATAAKPAKKPAATQPDVLDPWN